MATAEIREQKRQIRQENKNLRLQMPKDERAEKSKRICTHIINSVSFKYADTVLMFCPTDEEIDILPVFHEAKKAGKRVAFPRCYAKGIMKFFYVEDISQMTMGKYGIMTPEEGEEFVSSQHPICVVPSLAATKEGTRLGYGGGFYDRFLHKFDGISMCVQYDCFVCEALPQEKRYDKKFDVLVTESGVKVVG